MPAITTDESKLLVTAEELSKLTGWSKQSLYRRARRGEIPCVRTGVREVRFDPVAVRRWIVANSTFRTEGAAVTRLLVYGREMHFEVTPGTALAVGDKFDAVRAAGPREGDLIGDVTVIGFNEHGSPDLEWHMYDPAQEGGR